MAQVEIACEQSPEAILSSFPSLLGDEIHVWHLSLDALSDLERLTTGVLSCDERNRAGRYVRREDSARFAVCRGVLRLLLARYLDIAPAELLFRYGAAGKPFLPPHWNRPIEFNVSHSGTEALLAFAWDTPVGVDIEMEQAQVDCSQIAQHFFSPWEEKQICALPLSERTAAFYRVWTRKEAFIKATGLGLSFPLDAFDVDPEPAGGAGLRDVRWDAFEAGGWQLTDLTSLVARPGIAAALAYCGAPRRLLWDAFPSVPDLFWRKS